MAIFDWLPANQYLQSAPHHEGVQEYVHARGGSGDVFDIQLDLRGHVELFVVICGNFDIETSASAVRRVAFGVEASLTIYKPFVMAFGTAHTGTHSEA